MANNSSTVAGSLVYPWNPFQDIDTNRKEDELVHVEGGDQGVVIVPRLGPFFANKFKIKLVNTGRELSFANGEYGFIYPFGSFIKTYNKLVYGGILVKGVTGPTDFAIEYEFIGDKFVLDDIAYGQLVAKTLTSPRTVDYSELDNLPTEWPSDPHPHPISDSYNWGDMMTWCQSYLMAITDNNVSVTVEKMIKDHIGQDIDKAHKATLGMLSIQHLKDYPIATLPTHLEGENTNMYASVWAVKALIRSFNRGEWS